MTYLSDLGFTEIYAIADPTMRHNMKKFGDADEKEKFESKFDRTNPYFLQAPSGVKADTLLLQFGLQKEAVIITKDHFRDFQESHPAEYSWFLQHHVQPSLLADTWILTPKLNCVKNPEKGGEDQ